MKYLWIGCCLWLGLGLAGATQPPDLNVNSRYTIESVQIAGEDEGKLPAELRHDIMRLVGEKLDSSAITDLARRIRRELKVRAVTHRVLRGSSPQYVKVVFEIKGRAGKFDLSLPKFLYHSKQGWSAAVEAAATIENNRFSFGLVSDGDELAERYAGLVARYENKHVGTDRVRLGFEFESYHQQWNGATLQAIEAPGALRETSPVYRTRQNFQPVVTLVLARPLTLSVGTSFQRFQVQYPLAHTEAANAAVASLRYRRRVEDSGLNRHDLDAGYALRAATRALDSDYVYARHVAEFRYALSRGHHVLIEEVATGVITGRAPLFERFFLGNSSTLRGWNKFDLEPLGGNRMVHNTVEYRYRVFQIFYDTGAVWNDGREATPRHAMGVGLRKGSFSLAVAFPIRDGRAEPVFMVGMNY